ncbi:MAG: hypothetical protein JWM95_754 [Gemmatimonadetes bacterium]|nr:hypothetical protein [Gemmatimonadota bacterium]
MVRRGQDTEDDRRQNAPRREADLEQTFNQWAAAAIRHRVLLLSLVAGLASVVTYAATALGMRYVGPKEDIQRVDRKVDTLAARIARVEKAVADGSVDRDDIKRALGWVIYMQCTETRTNNPAAVPPICNEPRKP